MSETKCILVVCYLLISVVFQIHGQVTEQSAVFDLEKVQFYKNLNCLSIHNLYSILSLRESMKCKWKKPNKWHSLAKKSCKPPRMTWKSFKRSRNHRPRVENVCMPVLWSLLAWYVHLFIETRSESIKVLFINTFILSLFADGWWKTIDRKVYRTYRRDSTRE